MNAFESAILQRLDRIDATLQQLVRNPDAALLAEIARTMQARAFTAREVTAVAEDTPRLRKALVARVARSDATKSLGRWLARMEGFELSGMRVERVGECNQGALWIIREFLRETNSQSDSTVLVPDHGDSEQSDR